LEGRPEVREAVRERFQALLIDEFQDTSRVQQRLVELVRSPDQTFVVGDVKQSIYGFRHAEVRGLLGYEAQVQAQGGEVVALDVSFRTRPEVLQWVDDVFARQFGPGSEVPHQPLRAGCEFLDKPLPSVELLVGRGDSMERARGQEARAVAGRLATLVEGQLLTGTNPLREDTCGQPLRYRDCASCSRWRPRPTTTWPWWPCCAHPRSGSPTRRCSPSPACASAGRPWCGCSSTARRWRAVACTPRT
jgi:ATP-dependent exoDNAse (exonuclease V) beta subunit